jgi:Reverse transcriptase (RNA-dependent DNA polymerase)
MDERTVQELGLGRKPLTRPGKVWNINGTENKAGMLTHYCELRVRIGAKEGVQKFFITNLGQERTIVGYPWVEYFDPPFDWKNKKLKGDIKVELEAKYYKWIQTRAIKNFIRTIGKEVGWEQEDKILKVNMAQQWAEAAQQGKKEVQIPERYREYEEVFSEEVAKCFPPSRPEDHAIKLKPGAPETINCKVYPLTATELEATKKFIEEHEGKNYIQKTDSPWSTPWFFIKKKDSSLRPIQDYREVNKWTIRDVYPIPRIKQIMEQLKDKHLFTKFDVQSGYHNIRIKEEDRWKAAFKTPYGLFQPNVMFFGLTNSPATFQRFMDCIFRSLTSGKLQNT